jgi:Protein of unknown function (DUF2958)
VTRPHFLTEEDHAKLIENGQRQAKVAGTEDEADLAPVVKLFNPTGRGTWLLTEIDAELPHVAWGLCDLGFGTPEYGSVDLRELADFVGRAGLRIERDRYFTASGPMSKYMDEARRDGFIDA